MMTNVQKAKIQRLRYAGKSYSEISREMNIKRETIKSFLRRHPGLEGDVHCEFCGKLIEQNPKTKPKRFCSDKCRMQWWNSHPEQVNRKAYYTFICNHCGKEFTVYGKRSAKYCSTQCYAKARADAYEAKREKLKSDAVSCGAVLQDLPSGCICVDCPWFVDGKRSCPCKEKVKKEV